MNVFWGMLSITCSRSATIFFLSNKKAFTSVITLYDCNRELLKHFKMINNNKVAIKDYLRLRPTDEEIGNYKDFVFEYWNSFHENTRVIQEYTVSEGDMPAEPFRNRETGGHLLFRPIGLLPYVTSTLEIKQRHEQETSLDEILCNFNNINMAMNKRPWIRFLWNDHEKKMISGDNMLVKFLLIYMYDPDLLKENELRRLDEKYKGKIGDIAEATEILREIRG